jgi:anti-anti-sigma regulatory factor
MTLPIFQPIMEPGLSPDEWDSYRRLRRRVYAFIAVKLIFGGLLTPIGLLGVVLVATGQAGVSAVVTIALDTLFAVVYIWLVRRGYMVLGTLISIGISTIAVSIGLHLAGFTFTYSILYLFLILAAGLLLEDRRSVFLTATFSSAAYVGLAMLELSGLWPSEWGLVKALDPPVYVAAILIVLICLWGGSAIVTQFIKDKTAQTTRFREARDLAERHAQGQEEARRQAEQALAQRDQVVAQLQAALAEQARLDQSLRELSVPIIPVWTGVLVLPLVGVIDTQRATQVIDSLLQGIEQQRAQTVIVDITGVPVVDPEMAQVLLEVARSAALMGCRTVLTGIRPEVAQALVRLGADLSALVTRADLQSGVEYALQAAH